MRALLTCLLRFLHASLQVEMLLRCRSLHAVRATISNIPSGIEDLYARTVSRIPREDSALARLVFIWILHAKGNLTIEDLQYAVAVTPDTYQFQEEHIVSEEDLISICCGLVNVEAQSRHVRFIRECVDLKHGVRDTDSLFGALTWCRLHCSRIPYSHPLRPQTRPSRHHRKDLYRSIYRLWISTG